MPKSAIIIIFILVMVALIVGFDVLFLPGERHFWPRLAVNVGIVLVFAGLYLRFFA